MKNKLELGKLGFYWRMTEESGLPKNPVPDFVDFSFTFWEEYQLIIQTRNEQTWGYLETIYRENYNVGYLQEGHDLSLPYGNDFIEHIEFAIRNFNPTIKRVSEIGAGGCYILNRLKSLGIQVAAIDPSPISKVKGDELGIEIIPEFYPSSSKIPKSDMIIHYDVLEHVNDPAAFLKSHIDDLNENGLVLFAVPDCSSYIASGDISMILHEHLNYFDSISLKNVVEASGLEVLDIRKANYGGVLYCIAKKSEVYEWTPANGCKKFDDFVNSFVRLNAKVRDFIVEGTRDGNVLGCYIPLRAIPYLTEFTKYLNIRFFDDNSGIHNQYFDGFNIKVENRRDLLEKPVTHLLIMSSVFGEKIKSQLASELIGNQMVIMSLTDFVES